jgi:hypothetical protein
MNVSEASVLTTNLTNEIAIIPKGARTIDIINTGSSTIYFLGDSSQGALTLSAVPIETTQAYSFGNVSKPYPNIVVDCTGSSASISAVY